MPTADLAAGITNNWSKVWRVAECSSNLKGNLVRELRLASRQDTVWCSELHLRSDGGPEVDALRYENECLGRRNEEFEGTVTALVLEKGRGTATQSPPAQSTVSWRTPVSVGTGTAQAGAPAAGASGERAGERRIVYGIGDGAMRVEDPYVVRIAGLEPGQGWSEGGTRRRACRPDLQRCGRNGETRGEKTRRKGSEGRTGNGAHASSGGRVRAAAQKIGLESCCKSADRSPSVEDGAGGVEYGGDPWRQA